MYKIMLIEDDPVIAGQLADFLRSWNYEVVLAADYTAVLAEFCREMPQLVLLDISLPYYNGYYWCEQIRKVSKVPIIFISGQADNMNIIMAVNQGGDDFIAKPFDLSVLAAKVSALLRRTYDFGESSSFMEYQGFILNLAEARLLYQERSVELTKNEYRILQTLFEAGGSLVSREEMMRRLWESELFIDDNTLTVNMTRLRKKLEKEQIPEIIETKKGIGYRLGKAEKNE